MINVAIFLTYAFGLLGVVTALLLGSVRFTKGQREKYPLLKWLDGKQVVLLVCTILFLVIAYGTNAWKDMLATEGITYEIEQENYTVAEYLIGEYYEDSSEVADEFYLMIEENKEIKESERQKDPAYQLIGRWKLADTKISIDDSGSDKEQNLFMSLIRTELVNYLNETFAKQNELSYLDVHTTSELSWFTIEGGQYEYLYENRSYIVTENQLVVGSDSLYFFMETDNSMILFMEFFEFVFQRAE